MNNLDRNNIERILRYSQDFKDQSMGLESAPPYAAINPLVYLGALETHISRLFADILRYKIYDKETKKFHYLILDSFVKRFFNDQGIEIDSPKIYAEWGNVDILIKDRNYVIIIENKIKDAEYQPWQPAKYVQKHKSADTKVFVVLLPKYMDQDDKTYIDTKPFWQPAKGAEKLTYACPGAETNNHADCYVRAIHKDFAEWLSQVVKGCGIPQKETLLKSNLEILVDYLNRIYGIHNTSKQEKYKMDKIELLKDILGYDSQAEASLDSLLELKNQIDDIWDSIKALHEEVKVLQEKTNMTYGDKVQDYMDDCYDVIQRLSAEEKERMGEEVSWPWLGKWNKTEKQLGITVFIKSGSVNVGIQYDEAEQRVLIGIPEALKMTKENVDQVNVVLSDLGLNELSLSTRKIKSEMKGYPFSEARDQIIKLITALFEIKHKRQ